MPFLGTHRLSGCRQIRRRLRAGMLASGLALAGLVLSAAPAAAATYQVPSSIAGDCSVNVTSALRSWIGSVPDGSTLSFGTSACYRIEGTLQISSRSGLDFEGNGSTFESFNAPTDSRPIWQAWQSTGLIFRNMNVVGSYASGGTFNSSLQHSHGFDLRGTGAEIAGVAIKNVGGDCVYFGLGSDGVTRSTGSVHNSSCSGTSRNGVSVTAGTNILVQYVSTNAIGYDVFDVEPNTTTGNWGAQGVTFDSNTIGSYALSAFSVVENAPISSQSFTNNTVTGQGLKITVGGNTVARPQGITITGNSSNTAQAPAAMNVSSVDGLTVTGNTVPMTTGTMASVDSSCSIDISGNSYPGGSPQDTISPYSCSSGTSTTSAVPTVTITSPSSGVTLTGSRATIAASASSTAVKMAVFVDGNLLSSSASTSMSTTWNLKKVSSGSHTITVDAWNASNGMGSSAVTVYK
ncbi:MAG: Ig-like domain-containing protein [Solirubrobacteraceae bacterium]